MSARAHDITLRTLQIVLGAVILLAASAINRSPFVYYDTSHYLQFGRSILTHLALIDPAPRASAPDANATPSDGAASAEADAQPKPKEKHTSLSYAGGRSPYYSLFLFAGTKIGGFWAVAFVQAIIAAWMLWLAVEAFAPSPYRNGKSYVLLTLGLTAFSPLSFYVGMTMPDVLAGLALLGTALIVFGYRHFSTPVLIILVLVTGGCAATHATTPVVCFIALLGIAASALLLLGRASLRYAKGLLLGFLPIALAIAAGGASQAATRLALGESAKSPPYLMARLLADGTGQDYLREACHPEPRYVLCKFEGQAIREPDDFLWSGNPKIGVFSLADYDTRAALQAEELRFVLGTITSFPLKQLKISLGHWLNQITYFGLGEFGAAAQSWNQMAFEETVPELSASYKASLAYEGRLPLALFEWMQWIGVASSVALIAYWIARSKTWTLPDPSGPAYSAWTFWLIAAGGLLVVLIGNAALCGALSGENHRYQARIIWLVPLFATLVGVGMLAEQRRATRETSTGRGSAALAFRAADARRDLSGAAQRAARKTAKL